MTEDLDSSSSKVETEEVGSSLGSPISHMLMTLHDSTKFKRQPSLLFIRIKHFTAVSYVEDVMRLMRFELLSRPYGLLCDW